MMHRESELLLAEVRHAEDPTQADEERVLRALQAAVAAGKAPSVQASGRDGWLAKPFAKLGASGLKQGAVIACLAAAVAAVYLLSATRNEPEPARSVPTPAAPRTTQREAEPEPIAEPAAEATDARVPPLESARARTRRQTANSLRPEIELLQRVQAALKHGDGTEALRELDAHRTADRALLAERQAARILALCMLGRVTEARITAEQFATQHPDSPQRAAIESSCANSRRIEEL